MPPPFQELELLPGNPGTPLFKTPEEYQAFRESWYETVIPKLEALPRHGFTDPFKIV